MTLLVVPVLYCLIQEVRSGQAEALGLESARGALVAQVQPNSPASKAGLEDGDLIQTGHTFWLFRHAAAERLPAVPSAGALGSLHPAFADALSKAACEGVVDPNDVIDWVWIIVGLGTH